MAKKDKKWLSHSGIDILERCPRCFWLHYNRGIRQPEGIVSRLANRFDVILKNYFNIYRPLGELPPMVEKTLDGKLENPFQEKYFIPINETYGFWGKLDECIVNDKGEYIPIDFKTASSDPRNKETLASYQSQIDDYNFLLQNSHKKIVNCGYLVYFFPDESHELHSGFPMIIHVVKLPADPAKTQKRIANAINILERPIPDPSPNCPFCSWYEAVKNELGPALSPKKVKAKSPQYQQEKLI